MNFSDLNLDLQGVMRRTYANLLYKSTFMNFLNPAFMQVARSTGTPVIEVIKQMDTPLNQREGVEIKTALTNSLAGYNSVMVKLTDLALDYSFRISPIMTTTPLENVIQGQMDKKDSQIAKAIDTYGYKKLSNAITGYSDGSQAYSVGQVFKWAPATKDEYVDTVNTLKSILFDRDIYDGYQLGLISTEYAKYVSALTSIIKYETRTGVEAVDRGVVAAAYGVDTFEINSGVVPTGIKGFFGHAIAAVGDMFFSAMAQYNGNFPGFPGYWVLEGNILFGAEVVRPEAIIKLASTEVVKPTE